MITKEECELNKEILKKSYPNLEELEKKILTSSNLLKNFDNDQIEKAIKSPYQTENIYLSTHR